MQPQTPTLDFDDVNNAFIATPSPSLQSTLPARATANKGTNNRNNVSRNIMTVSGMNDPLLPSKGVTRYDVEGKGSPPVHTPSRTDSGHGKEGYNDYDSEGAESSLCCC